MSTLAADVVLTPDREVRPGTVTIDDGRVTSLGDAAPTQLEGTLLPGFVDLQCNGAAGFALRDATDAAFEGVAKALVRAGVTSWCPTLPTAPPDVYPRFLDAAAAAGTRPGPRVLGVHLEGPFLNPVRKGAHDPALLRTPDAAWLESLLDRHPDLIRIVTLAPELPGAHELIELCVERGVVVSVGHSDASADQAAEAFDRGAIMLTHLFNGMRPIHHRDPGIAGEAVQRRDVVCGLIADGVHVDSKVASFFVRALGPSRVCVVSDAVASPSPLPLLSGGFTLLDGALQNLVSWGIPLRDAMRTLTRTPAETVGAHDVGSLEPGSHADLVLWRDGAVSQVWIAGLPQ